MSDEHLSLEQYRELENAVFPVEIREGTLINSLDIVSDCCEAPVTAVRMKTHMLNDKCAQILLGGHCSKCGNYDSGKLKWYVEEKQILEFNDDGYGTIDLAPDSPLDKIKHGSRSVLSALKDLTF